DTYLQETAASANALISNNSWGYVGANDYISASASYDAAVRDALPQVPGSQPVLYVFAAGNDGFGGNDGQGGFADTIVAPGTAKNVITVGATESPRGITNQFVTAGITNDLFAHMTDSQDQIAGFSSRGPVGAGIEGDFGRFKPDVVAPGVFTVSTRTQSPGYGQGAAVYYSDVPNYVPGQSVPANKTVVYPIDLPDNAVGFLVRLQPNSSTVLPMPDLGIKSDKNNPPTTFQGYNDAFVTNVSGGRWYFSVQNTNSQPVHYDLRTVIVVTNDVGNYFEVLRDLDEPLKPYYRFESGTSMAAPAVTGTLALMQEFFRDTLHLTPSPALLKAMLINGSRSLNHTYDFYHKADVVYQGWGMVNLTNSIPAGLSNITTSPLQFVDQSPSTALATGEEYTRILTLNTNGVEQDFPLRVTLVWTDPPGNPVAGVKLVNDLDLIITNLDTSEVFSGNNFEPGSVITSGAPSPIGDKINNVENVFLVPSGGGRYSITVRGSRVNVNAVTDSLKGIAQDFALVISTENVFTSAPYSLSTPSLAPASYTNYAVINGGAPILNQHVGANSPLLGSIGSSNQWNFYVFTNTAGFTNVAFVTFLPPNLSTPRNTDADIDLYVSKNPALFRLDPNAILLADKSTNRGGTETVIYTNASSTLNDVYYVGVKSEDQSGAEFGFFAVANRDPFSSRDADGNLIIRGVPATVDIPDGTPKVPGQAFIFALTAEPDIVQRVTVTNTITHELFGDLYGVLDHAGSSSVLFNHLDDPLNPFLTRTFLFDDSNSGDNLNSRTTPGPGSLENFVGKKATGAWILNMLDNTLTHTGRVDFFSIKVEPQQTNLVDRTIQPGRYYFDFADVPLEGTNLSVTITYPGAVGTQGAIDVFIREADLPTLTEYDKTGVINPPGGTVSLGLNDSPPLFSDLYYIGFYNPNSFPVRIRYKIKVDLNLAPTIPTSIVSSTPVDLLDDAKTKSSINVTNVGRIADVSVNLQINHPRISDLSVRLVSPSGTKALLMENRGGPSAANFDGYFTDNTNFFPVPIKFAAPPFTPRANFIAAPLMIDGFEGLGGGDIVQGGSVGAFTVLTNQVSVVAYPAGAAEGNNFLALGLGDISASIPTTTSKYYSLSYASRQSDLVAEWAADNNFDDVTGHGNQGVRIGVNFVTGLVGQAFSFLPASRVALGNPPSLAFTNSFAIEGWIQLTNYGNSFVIFRGDARNGLDPYYLGTDASGHLVFHIENALTNATEVT
ncbi:MAG: Peptidase and in kexin sedolisin, partial [Verrucomicrobiales bacterium]|nr:Peptidase and in kexin sedolisin [Verrucomicrobiales bacterium]